MKVLITGGKGQLGSQVYNMLKTGTSELGCINPIYNSVEVMALGVSDIDISDLEVVKNYLSKVKPDIVINCAAYTNVDDCEENYDIAFKVNSLGARNLAIGCEKIESKLVHISTDYVFGGKGEKPYKESDRPCPISVYGKTKFLGEEYVKNFSSKYFVVRTSWLYGYNGKNFVKAILNAATDKKDLEVVDDQRGNPTNVEDLAYHILKLALTEEYGIYHCSGTGECSWYDFAHKIIEYAGIKCKIKSIKSDKLTRAAKRPSYSSLDNMMLRCTIGDEMRNWEDALRVFIDKLPSRKKGV